MQLPLISLILGLGECAVVSDLTCLNSGVGGGIPAGWKVKS